MLRLLSLSFIFSISLADTKTVAISYFDNTSGTKEYDPLSKGLADMLITDLSNVKSLKIVEREKLESLLKEIELGDGKFIDPNTAQKLGKGLGAGYMLTGSFLIMGKTMRIDARLVDVGTGEVTMAEEITGEKDTFFELEKSLVDKLVTTFDIVLSKSEQRKVKKVQTESFDAFNTFASAIDAYDKEEYVTSKKLFEKATEIDEDYDIAWERLDNISDNLEKLLKIKELFLSEDVLLIVNNLSSGSKSDCENFQRMFRAKWNELAYFTGFINENFYSALYPTHPKNYLSRDFLKNRVGELVYESSATLQDPATIVNKISEKYETFFINGKEKKQIKRYFKLSGLFLVDSLKSKNVFQNLGDSTINSIDDYVKKTKSSFDALVNLLKYLESKNFTSELCSDHGGFVGNWYLQNPNQLIGTWFITRDWTTFEDILAGIIKLEFLADRGISVEGFDGETVNIKTALDDLIIYFGNKYLQNFPLESDRSKIDVINQAINRKKNPSLYESYLWLLKYSELSEKTFGAMGGILGDEAIIYDYNKKDPLPTSMNKIPYINTFYFKNCLLDTQLVDLEYILPDKTVEVRNDYGQSISESENNIIDLMRKRLSEKISDKDFNILIWPIIGIESKDLTMKDGVWFTKLYDEPFTGFLRDSKPISNKEDSSLPYWVEYIAYSYQCSDGIKDGFYKEWYNDRVEKVIGKYQKGIQAGKWFYFDSNGDTLKSIRFMNDGSIGEEKFYRNVE